MIQITKPPAFSFYAANITGNRNYKRMSYGSKSLWLSLVCEYWMNGDIPNDQKEIACLISGFTESDVTKYLPEVMWYFRVIDNHIFCPELEAQKQRAAHRSDAMAEAGKKSAAIRKEKAAANDYAKTKNGEM